MSDHLLVKLLNERIMHAEAEKDEAEAERDRYRAALEAASRGLDSLARYRHQPSDPFPYGAVTGIASIVRHALAPTEED